MAYIYGRDLRLRDSLRNSDEKNSRVYTKDIYGSSIKNNKIPEYTARPERTPFVTFQAPDTGKAIGFSTTDLAKGLALLASPGGGKTNVIFTLTKHLLPAMGKEDVMIIFDTKGDYLKEFGNKIPTRERIVIGSGEKYAAVTSYPNFFAEIMPKGLDGRLVYTPDSDIDAEELASHCLHDMPSENQPVFPAMAEQVIAGVLIYFMRRYWQTDQSKLNNKEFIQFFQSHTTEELAAVFEKPFMSDKRSCVSYLKGKSSHTQGVSAYIGTVLQRMFAGPFAKADPAREVSMMQVIRSRQKKVIFIEYDLMRGHALAPVYGILIDQALKHALGGREEKRQNVYFILDEYILLPKLLHASNGLSFGRSRGVKIIAGIQNVSALEDKYGQAAAASILAGFQNIIAFTLTDRQSRAFLMDRLGKNYRNTSYCAWNKNMNIQREGNTLEEWELMNLNLGEAVVSMAGEKPFLFRFPKYEK